MNRYPSLGVWLTANRNSADGLVLDVDGVLVRGRETVPDANAFISQLRAGNVPFVLLTNDGSHSRKERSDELCGAGVAVAPDEIVSSSDALGAAAARLGLDGGRFFVMGTVGNPCYAEAAGLRTTRSPDDLSGDGCDGVIVGEGHYDWERTVNGVINFFAAHPDAVMIVPNPDGYYPGANDSIYVAAGGLARFMVRILAEHGVSVSPVYLGKPHGPVFEYAHRELERKTGRSLARPRIVMVGDSLDSDVAGARAFGYRAALVLTGVTRPDRVADADPQPDLVFDTL